MIVIEDVKFRAAEPVYRITVTVGHRNIGQHFARVGMENVSALVRYSRLRRLRANPNRCGSQQYRGDDAPRESCVSKHVANHCKADGRLTKMYAKYPDGGGPSLSEPPN